MKHKEALLTALGYFLFTFLAWFLVFQLGYRGHFMLCLVGIPIIGGALLGIVGGLAGATLTSLTYLILVSLYYGGFFAWPSRANVVVFSPMALFFLLGGILGLYRSSLEKVQKAKEALEKSEKRFQDIAASAGSWIWEVDAEGRYTYSSPVVEQVLGYRPEEVVGKFFYDFFHPDEREKLKSAAFNVFGKKEPLTNFVNPSIRKDGHVVLLETSGVPIIGPRGELLGYRGADRDVTERMRIEKALQESEEKYRSLVNNVKLGIFRSTPGPRGRFLEVNPVMEEITGYTREELLQMDVSSLYLHPEEREKVLEHMAAATGKATKELEFKRKDGARIIVSDTKVAVRDKSGEILYFDGIIEDITERKRVEKEREKLFRELNQRVNELSCLHELASSIRRRSTLPEIFQDVARLLEQAWGHPEITRARVIFDNGQYTTRVFEPTRWRQSADILIRGEKRGEIEVFYLAPQPGKEEGPFTKEERFLLDNIANTLGEAIERREAEEEKARASAMAAALREADRIKTNFISIASHELRTPLTVLVGFSELLLGREAPEEKRRDWLERIHRESKRLSAVVDDLLNVSRIQSGRVVVEQQPLDLPEIAREAVQSVAMNEKHSVVFDFPEGLSPVVGDRDKLTQILVNLVDNAVKYSPQGGKITVAAHQEPERMVVSVSDQGIGIASEDQEKLFTTFTRIRRPEVEKIRGTGLGLYIVKALVELMGGEIWVESELGKGSTFFFSLPLFKERGENEEKINAGR